MAKKTTIQRSNMTQTDSKGKVTREAKDNSQGNAVNFHWWRLPDDEKAAAIAATLTFLREHQGARIEQLTVSTRLRGNSNAYNLAGAAFTRASSVNSNPSSQRMSYNLCSSVIDTLASKMAKNKVVPTYITNGGVWDIQKKAKNLTKFTQGIFYGEKVHEKSIEAFDDGATWGDGFVHVFRKHDKVCIERTLPHELFVDQIESMCTSPQQLHRVKIVDRDVAKAMVPELEEAIDLVSPANFQEIGGYGTAADLVTLVESWHLKSGPDADDGVHVISCGDGAISDEYDKDYFPFPHFRYQKRKLGWYGQGACERLQNIQGEINRSLILKQKSLWMMASFKVLLEDSSKIVSQHINNDIGTLIRYQNTKPEYITPPATNPELQQWIDSLIEKGYDQEGISKMSSTGQVPLGVDSGKAMRALTQISDDRFLFMGQEMEAFVLEIARQAIEVVKDIYKDKKSYEVVFPTTNFIETVDWKDIDLDASQYVLKAYPTSALADDLSGRLSDVQELVQAGMISQRTAMRLMQMPDVEMMDNLANAAEDRLHQMFEKMLDGGKVIPVEAPFHDLQLAKQLVMEYYNYAEFMNAPDDLLQVLQDFNDLLNDALGINQPQPLVGGPVGPPQPGAPGAPPANPQPTPQSNLIPNVNQPGAPQ
jgi:hypothetical protein